MRAVWSRPPPISSIMSCRRFPCANGCCPFRSASGPSCTTTPRSPVLYCASFYAPFGPRSDRRAQDFLTLLGVRWRPSTALRLGCSSDGIAITPWVTEVETGWEYSPGPQGHQSRAPTPLCGPSVQGKGLGLPWAPRRTAWVGQQGASIFRRRGNLNSYPLSTPQRCQAVLRRRAEFKATRVGAPSGPSTDLAGKPSPVSKTGARGSGPTAHELEGAHAWITPD